jgi:pyridinium-3,5-bisthiocarboxylic acid mononucleotide nickel chelatase
VLETNLDDVSAEVIGFCTERLFAAGALDVFVVHGQMKKGRPGFLISVIATPGTEATLEAILFRETGTFGIRRQTATRSKLRRESATVSTPWGEVKAKLGWHTDGSTILTPEYEDCARLARERGIPLRTIYNAITPS